MLKEMPFANALAGVTGGLYLVCALLFAVAPDLFREIARTWFHGYDLSVIPPVSIAFGGILTGLITVVAITWVFGYLLAWVYNKLAK